MNALRNSAILNRKFLVFAVAAALLVALAWYVDSNVTLDSMVEQENQLRSHIGLNPWRAFLVGFGVYLALSLVPGTGGKAIVSGWLFGFWQAVIIVSVGLTIAAMLIFYLARYLLRDIIERRYGSFVSVMNRHIEKEGAFYLLFLRMAHAPYSIVNPVSGASRVAAKTFLWTTAFGLMPANIIWIYVGINLPSLRELAAIGPNAFLSAPLLAALIGCGALPLLVRWLIGHFSAGIDAGEFNHISGSDSTS